MTREDRFEFSADARYRTIPEDRILEILLLSGWAFEISEGKRDDALRESRSALDRWVDLGLPFARSALGERLFDSAEVVNFLKWVGLFRGDRFWEDRFVATGRRLAVSVYAPDAATADPPHLSGLRPKRFDVTLRREFNLAGRQPSGRARLRLPLPIDDEGLRDLEFSILPPGIGDDRETFVTPGRLDAVLRAPAGLTAALGIKASFTAFPAPGAPGSLDPAERELYTRPSEGLIQVTPHVAALAEGLAGSEREPLALAGRFWSYIIDNLFCGVVRYEELPSGRPLDFVLAAGWFDCQLGSALLAALCRARKIPARVNSGHLLYELAPTYHYWVEIWCGDLGWLPFDLLSWDLSAGGRDRAWKDYFFGRLDYRFKTERLPRLFTGLSPVRLPPAWRILLRPLESGIEIGFVAVPSGEAVFTDQISVTQTRAAGGHAAGLESTPPIVNASPLLP